MYETPCSEVATTNQYYKNLCDYLTIITGLFLSGYDRGGICIFSWMNKKREGVI